MQDKIDEAIRIIDRAKATKRLPGFIQLDLSMVRRILLELQKELGSGG